MWLSALLLAAATTLRGGEVKQYALALTAGEAVELEAAQDGIDVVLAIDGPGGKAEVDSPNGTQGVEPLLFVAAAGGAHTVTVRALDADAPPGRFTLRLVARRPATAGDRARFEAAGLIAQGYAIRAEMRQAAALPLAERAVALLARSAPGSVELAGALSLRGYLRDELGDYPGGGADFARALAIYVKRQGAASPLAITTRSNLAYLRLAEGRFAEAEALFRATLAARAKSGGDLDSARMGLGVTLRYRGRLDEAEAQLRAMLAERERRGGAERVASGQTSLGVLLVRRGKLDEGEAMCARAAEVLTGRPGFAGRTAAAALQCVAEARLVRGDLAGARERIEASLTIREAIGADHPSVADSLTVKGRVQLAAGDLVGARASLERALAIREKTWKRPHPDLALTQRALAEVARAEGRRN